MKYLSKDKRIAMLLARSKGQAWTDIGKAYGLTGHRAHRAADPEFDAQCRIKEQRRERKRRQKIKQQTPKRIVAKQPVVPQAEVEAARTWQDLPDTRDFTGLLMGDPFPGRSALDRRCGQGGRA